MLDSPFKIQIFKNLQGPFPGGSGVLGGGGEGGTGGPGGEVRHRLPTSYPVHHRDSLHTGRRSIHTLFYRFFFDEVGTY